MIQSGVMYCHKTKRGWIKKESCQFFFLVFLLKSFGEVCGCPQQFWRYRRFSVWAFGQVSGWGCLRMSIWRGVWMRSFLRLSINQWMCPFFCSSVSYVIIDYSVVYLKFKKREGNEPESIFWGILFQKRPWPLIHYMEVILRLQMLQKTQ